jgi:hypothetical protein
MYKYLIASSSYAHTKQQYVYKVKNSSLMPKLRFEVFMVVTMKNAIFWDVMPCGSCKN